MVGATPDERPAEEVPVPPPATWDEILSEAWRRAAASPPRQVTADGFQRAWPSLSRPVALECDDRRIYVVKSLRGDRDMRHALTTEHVSSRLGRHLRCPIPDPVLVNVPADLINLQPEMAHVRAGLGHGVELMPDCGDRQNIGAPQTNQARTAYPLLATLYGWFHCPGDHQVIVSTASRDVYSVDHGLFLPGQDQWSAATLDTAPDPVPDPVFAVHCSEQGLFGALGSLARITDEMIADAIASVPTEWGMPEADLLSLGRYLSERRGTMVAAASNEGS